MSYYTQLAINWDDSDYTTGSMTPELVVESAKPFIAELGWSEDGLDDLRKSCMSDCLGQPGFKNCYADGVIALIQYVSSQFPTVVFYAKGAGEEFHDLWIREFKGGAVLVERGPFYELIPNDSLDPA
jgi:hypothetical protein